MGSMNIAADATHRASQTTTATFLRAPPFDHPPAPRPVWAT
jgi:hypothetical protein